MGQRGPKSSNAWELSRLCLGILDYGVLDTLQPTLIVLCSSERCVFMGNSWCVLGLDECHPRPRSQPQPPTERSRGRDRGRAVFSYSFFFLSLSLSLSHSLCLYRSFFSVCLRLCLVCAIRQVHAGTDGTVLLPWEDRCRFFAVALAGALNL